MHRTLWLVLLLGASACGDSTTPAVDAGRDRAVLDRHGEGAPPADGPAVDGATTDGAKTDGAKTDGAGSETETFWGVAGSGPSDVYVFGNRGRWSGWLTVPRA